jgi:post-segregation antitoxin (ccd killing protein)
MNVNVYLPDDLGKRAKDADIPFSQLLRDAVVTELERREAMAQTLTKTETIQLELEDRDGNAYTGRFTGTIIDGNDTSSIYLTDDERVIFYDSNKLEYWIIEDPETDLEGWPNALSALGIKPVIDI